MPIQLPIIFEHLVNKFERLVLGCLQSVHRCTKLMKLISAFSLEQAFNYNVIHALGNVTPRCP